jgi:putative DNA methylase
MTHRKKLIEVALPLEAINKASAREKSIRHGHPSTLHLWWARRPLAACRAVLFASLVDDPDSDPMFAGDADIAASKRAELFNLIEELVQWENSNNPRVINRARAEIARCVAARMLEARGPLAPHLESGPLAPRVASASSPLAERVDHTSQPLAERVDHKWLHDLKHMLAPPEVVNAFLAEHAPPVLDPFCGGGSIPLEAQRLGLRAYASDLNPVPVLITKALIEIPPKFAGRPPVNPDWQKKSASEKAAKVWQGAQGLAEDVRYYGQWMRDEAEKRIGHLYPKVKITKDMAKDRPDLEEYVGQELTAIAWLWARTVASPNPACRGAHVPLTSSFWASTRKGREAYVLPQLERKSNSFRFLVRNGKATDTFDPNFGTIGRSGGRCILTDSPISLDYIRSEGMGGRLSQRLMAIICEGRNGRVYVNPNPDQEAIALKVSSPDNAPDTDLPAAALGFRVQRYGILKHRQLFSSRQLHTLCTLADLVPASRIQVAADALAVGCDQSVTAEVADAVATYLALSVSRQANRCSSQCFWDQMRENVQQVFARNALPFIWDFCEANPLSESSGNFIQQLEYPVSCLRNCQLPAVPGVVQQVDAQHAADMWRDALVCTDPPYYDNIGYAALSDFFYVWLRQCLRSVWPSLFATMLTPKDRELIAEPGRHSKRDAAARFFEDGLADVFCELRKIAQPDFPVPVFYAFKQSEEDDEAVVSTGWDTFLQGAVNSGWQVIGTWPLRTEQAGGLRVVGRNALASSIVVACRARPAEAPLTTRKQFVSELRRELPGFLRDLQHGNIAPVDVAQASIGPGMAVFTRYAKVMESDGSAMTVRTALGLINQALDEVLAEQEGEFDGDTRWALAWFEQFGTGEGPFGMAETLSKAKNTAVNGLVEAGVVRARAGKVQLVSRDDLPADWDPAADRRLTVCNC